MEIAHRIPNSNPMQAGAARAGQFFTVQDEDSVKELIDKYKLGSKYVVIDHTMPTTKFYAMAEWAGSNVEEFREVYYWPMTDGTLMPRVLYYPTYYQSIVVRLYNFDGKAVTSTQPIVISYEEKEYGGEKYKEITWGQYFSSYEDARAYVAAQTSTNYKIVGANPFDSPVPLEELNSYELVHESDARIGMGNMTLPAVKIFKYLDFGES
jgi:asparagine N-glycosylation enzyme membrane subunit Stt3